MTTTSTSGLLFWSGALLYCLAVWAVLGDLFNRALHWLTGTAWWYVWGGGAALGVALMALGFGLYQSTRCLDCGRPGCRLTTDWEIG